MTLGQRIREARERLGWTQVILAKRVGATASFITKLEKDQALPGQQLLQALAKELVIDGNALEELAERTRQDRAGERIFTRGHQANEIKTRADQENQAEADKKKRTEAASTAEQLGREILDNPDLQAGFTYLRVALADPDLNPVVLKVLEVFAQKARLGSRKPATSQRR
jgi:transcriptional regulator with XRE-family HTH domain